ncbi:MAG: hypothetical protein LC623_07940 [Halobacteriales archaeon]|nr:hypothetical protein [Halobacteriales archaeon]
MVLAVRVGRPRPFWAGLGLAAVTFTVYQYYWDFRTHDELYKQFELAREGREQGAVWYILGFILPVLRFVYYAHYVGNLRYLRARFGFQRSMTAGHFLGLAIPGTVAFFVGVFIGLTLANAGVEQDDAGNLHVTDAGLVRTGLTLAAVGLTLYVVLYGLAYARLQREVNEVWGAYDARAAALRSGAAAQAPGWLPAGAGSAPPPPAAPRPAPASAAGAMPPWRPPPPR